MLRYSEASGPIARAARCFGVPQHDGWLLQDIRAAIGCFTFVLLFFFQITLAQTNSENWTQIQPFFAPPEQFAGQLGSFRSPLLFDDGTPVRTAEDWQRRRQEILRDWHQIMGHWPDLIDHPKIEYVQSESRENFTQHKIRIEIARGLMDDGYLLIPTGSGPFPAVFVPYYEPQTSVGLGTKSNRDFALQLTRRGFVTLSIGSPGGDARKPDTAGIHIQPLSFLGYIGANCYNALASLPQVDRKRIGVVGHSYGGKWAMFTSCLDYRYAAAVWSDPGIVWDEARKDVNYWEPWYLGLDPNVLHRPGVVTPDNPRTGAYKALVEGGHDLTELQALMAPRPFMVSGGSEDQPSRWVALNHAVAVNKLLGFSDRVALTSRPAHDPTPESNEAIYKFFEHFLKSELHSAASSPAAPAMAVLKNNCLSCHNPEKKKGKLLLTSRELALKGNEDGPVIVEGKSAQSRLIDALSADADPHMPPKKQLDVAEIATLRAWIDAGVPWDDAALASSAPTTRPVELHAMPSTYRPVLAIALSPDEKQLAIGQRDRVFLRDLKQPARPIVRELEGPADAVRALAWSADGSRLAAGGYRRVRVWQMQSIDSPIDLQGLDGRITALCFVPQSDMLLAADGIPGGGGRIVAYQLPDPQPRNIIAAHADSIFALQCTRDGKRLASGGADKLVKLWDLPTFDPAGVLEGHTSHVLSLAFNADDSLLASGGADKDIKIWDIKTHEQKQTIGPHPFRVDAIAWPNGRVIFAAGDDGGLRRDNDNANAPGAALPSADDLLYCMAVTADGSTVFGGCHDGAVYVWVGGKLQTRLVAP